MDKPGRSKERTLDWGVSGAYRQEPDTRSDAAAVEAAAKTGGADGNQRLTAWTGAVLFVLLAVEGVTILKVGRFLTLHFFIGMLLLGPVALKAGSTIYRFYRYYTGSAPYRRMGPPQLLLRMLGPVVLLTTAGVFGSGIMLAVAGPGHGPWMFLHKASFVLWFCAMIVHVGAYLVLVPALIAAEFSGARGGRHAAQVAGRVAGRVGQRLGGRGMRIWLLIASLAAGLVIAMLTVHLAAPWHLARFNH